MNRRIFITGGTGFIGKHLVRELIENRNEKLTLLVRKSSDISFLEQYRDAERVSLVYGDINDPNALIEGISRADRIFHLAAAVDIVAQSTTMYEVNYQGTKSVIDAAFRYGTQIKYLLFLSSIGAIARSTETPLILDEEHNHQWQEKEKLSYHYSKYLAEQKIFQAFSRGLPAYCVNPSVVLGNGTDNNAVKKLIRIASFPVFCKPVGGINIVHVEDVISAMFKIVEKGRPGRRYLVANENVSFYDIFQFLSTKMQKEQCLIPIPKIVGRNIKAIKKLFLFSYFTNARLSGETGWKPAYNWRECLSATFRYINEHQ